MRYGVLVYEEPKPSQGLSQEAMFKVHQTIQDGRCSPRDVNIHPTVTRSSTGVKDTSYIPHFATITSLSE